MKTLKVWDLLVRVFHWGTVLTIIFQLVTADSNTNMHVKGGYVILLLVSARIIWGFIGSKHARFADFIYPPKEIPAYLTGLFKNNPRHYIGHNPAGGAMVITLLSILLLTAFAGLKTYGTEGKGPLAYLPAGITSDAYADEEHHEEDYENNRRSRHTETRKENSFWKEIHETLVGLLIFLIVLHILGVFASSYAHKENLILAMITGKKKIVD